MKKHFFVVLVGCLISMGVYSDEIHVGFRLVPPYVMNDANGNLSGIEYEIVVAALAAEGHTVKASTFPLARLLISYKNGEVMAAAPVSAVTNPGGYLSDSYITYQNVVMALKSRNLTIGSIADLKDLNIVAFQTASTALGKDFTVIANGNPKYREEGQQVTQIRMLFGNRADVVIGESRILNFFIKSPETAVNTSNPVEEFGIFPQTNYSVSFKDQKYAVDFNDGLKAIRKNGVYTGILNKYKN